MISSLLHTFINAYSEGQPTTTAFLSVDVTRLNARPLIFRSCMQPWKLAMLVGTGNVQSASVKIQIKIISHASGIVATQPVCLYSFTKT